MRDVKTQMAAGIAAFGVLAMGASGYLVISTPRAQECEVELASTTVRVELLTEAKDACKVALEMCVGGTP